MSCTRSALRPDLLLGLLLAVWACVQTASARPLKVATWNMDWLTLRPDGDPDLPSRRPKRGQADFEGFARLIRHLDADLIALQETDGSAPLRKIFPPGEYAIVLSRAPIVQNVALVLRHPWHAIAHEELTALGQNPSPGGHRLRPGLDLVVTDGKTTLRVLVVHLKSGCWERRWSERGHACPVLRQQIALLSDWIAEREDEDVPYLLLGDFNRRLTLADPYYAAMIGGYAPVLATAGFASPCRGGEYFIDHVIIGGSARSWLLPDSLRVMTQNDKAPGLALSDHCAVSVRFATP
ncbi:endonuclease/exonuclease/phosphatase family protein [Swaminathania salitolerans]|uniref:Metal-dependent hydrolase n=1 Tax=Swaminathania salitolerans TaxID=182838 RepID=A0A511BNV0_9PROT|nr:endonuclease/exonuclease/phosphatase family protein [Swaminathania salitolerans]GEL02016.1 metal-dependent hydrolase [Swaminathania salitolerans]